MPRPAHFGATGALVLTSLVCAVVSKPARADDKSGLSPSRIVLPRGPGSLGGIGENVEPNLSMGLMRHVVRIDLPHGYGALTPSLDLAYSSGAPAAETGIGWMLPVSFIQRMTARGVPRYDAADTFAAGDSEELVRMPGTDVFRARFEGGFVRYRWRDSVDGKNGFWTAEYPDGRIGYFGADQAGRPVSSARVAGPDGTFRYLLVELVDPFGHRIAYEYAGPVSCPVLARAAWAFEGPKPRYEAELAYGARPDPVSDGRAGFERVCDQRLRGIRVLVRSAQLRRYRLTYEDELSAVAAAGRSRLARVTQYGVGDAGPFPVAHSFAYTDGIDEALGAKMCAGDVCAGPRVVTFQNSLGLDLRAGAADLLDFNGDALPDLVDTAEAHHRIFFGTRDATGRFSFAGPMISNATSARLGLPAVQLVDLDGNGFVDVADLANLRVLWNRGTGDWIPEARPTPFIPDLAADADLRFLDVDGDKQIDLIHADRAATFYYLNRGDGNFEQVVGQTAVGAAFSLDGLQLADMNGDGLVDLVRTAPGLVTYRVNLGRGRWTEWREMLGLPEAWGRAGRFTDIDGDGLSDAVLVQADAVTIALNQSGSRFVVLPAVHSSNALAFPVDDGSFSIRFADMNGSGSTDIVWIDPSGKTTFLDFFGQRPNLLRRIDNGLGRTIELTYGSTTAHLARDGGADAWRHRLPHPMLTLDRIEVSDSFTGVKSVQTMHYRDGFYDGLEKQFRGFGAVTVEVAGDASVQAGVIQSRFDLGDADIYRKGLLLERAEASGGRALSTLTNVYGECPLAETSAEASPLVRWICLKSASTVVKEGADAALWTIKRADYQYDGYGNRTRLSDAGIVSVGGGVCPACEGGADEFGTACGATCAGDELFEETTFVVPPATGGRWMLRKLASTKIYGRADTLDYKQEWYHYDGEALVGLPVGQLTVGLLARIEARLVESGVERRVSTQRTRYNADGVPTEFVDARGARTLIGYDAANLLMTDETRAFDSATPPYALKMTVAHDPLQEQIVRASSWMRIEGTVASPERPTLYAYDAFGRLSALARPGATLEAPSERWQYDLGDPVSRIVHHVRSGGAAADELVDVQCFDGAGRKYQTLAKVAAGAYDVSGFSVPNVAGGEARSYQKHRATSDRCEPAAPAGVLFASARYDSTGRQLEATRPDAADHSGVASRIEKRYAPFTITSLDEEDTDPSSPHAATPAVSASNGLGRTVAYSRQLEPGKPRPLALLYDSLGNVAGYRDLAGNRRRYAYDLLGRLTRIDDPDAGLVDLAYDDVGNLSRRRDGRGATIEYERDEAGRILAFWEAGRKQETLVSYSYDRRPDCSDGHCGGIEGRLAVVSYPFGGGRGEDRYDYDERGRMVRLSRTIDRQTFELGYAYDEADRRTRSSYPGGEHVETTLDAAGRVAAIPGFVDAVAYGPRGEVASFSLGNGVKTNYRYDALERLAGNLTTQKDGRPLIDLSYERDRAGNVTSIVDGLVSPDAPSRSARYTYDALYRLATASLDPDRPAWAEKIDFGYDALDNLTSRVSSRGATSAAHVGAYRYDPVRQRTPVDVGGEALVHDAAGNVTRRGNDAFDWDYAGRLTSIRRGGVVSAGYHYDSGGERIKKAENGRWSYYPAPDFEVRDGVATTYVTLNGRRVGKIELPRGPPPAFLPDLAPFEAPDGEARPKPDGLVTAADAWAAEAVRVGVFRGSSPVEEDKVDELLSAAANRLLYAGTERRVTFLHQDHQGSLAATTNESGAAAHREWFFPHGSRRPDKDVDDEPYGFAGKEADTAAGVSYFGARYLSTRSGQWLSPDMTLIGTPAKLVERPFELGPFTYGLNNPVAMLDPDGNETVGEVIQRLGNEAADQGSTFGMAAAAVGGALWDVFGAEGVSKVADGRAGAGDYLQAGLEIAGAIPGGKVLKAADKGIDVVKGTFKTVGKEFVEKLEKEAVAVGEKAAEKAAQGAEKKVGSLVSEAPVCPCFGPGTIVATIDGPRAIETLRPGDLVLAGDEAGHREFKPVVTSFITPDKPVIELVVRGEDGHAETLRVTPNHPLWKAGAGWTAAGELLPGDVLHLSDGSRQARVESSASGTSTTVVYNLEVADYHTYFVGENATWAHNTCGPCDVPRGPGKANTPKSTLPRDEAGNFLPDPKAEGAHTTLGERTGRRETYTQGATFDAQGNFQGVTDVTTHGRGHPNPHFHPAKGPNSIEHGPHPLPSPEDLGL